MSGYLPKQARSQKTGSPGTAAGGRTDPAGRGREETLWPIPNPALASLTYGTAALYRDGAKLIAYHPESIAPMTHPPAGEEAWRR